MIGLTSITFRNKSIDEVIDFAKKSGAEAIEWGSDVHVPQGNIEAAIEVEQKCKKEGISICSYGSYYKLGENQDFKPYLDSAIALNTSRIRIWAGTRGSDKISDRERVLLIEECQEIAEKAAIYEIELCFEYHRKTLTDNKDSAYKLIHEIDRDNVFLYWQPNPEVSEAEKLEEIELLRKYIKCVHFFNWSGKNTRHLMSEGLDSWREYIKAINKDIPYLLEFTLDDKDENGIADIKAMADLIK
jgi:sugar phosphate isomerase/epimerase